MPSVRHSPPSGRIATPYEPPSPPAGPRRPEQARARRPDRGRKVRLHVPFPGAPHPGLQVLAVADLAPDRARAALARTGWAPDRYAARTLDEAAKSGATCVTDDAMGAIAHAATDVVIDATGHPAAGIAHALACCRAGKHIVMVNVEA